MAVNRKRSLYASNKYPELPQGGNKGDVIVKTDPYDGAAIWAPAPQAIPVGTVLPYAGKTVDLPWVPCDGRWYAREELPELYEMMLADAFPYGGDATQGRFAVPNLAGRTVIGSGHGYEVGAPGGEHQVTLTEDQMPKHSHQSLLEAFVFGDLHGAQGVPGSDNTSGGDTVPFWLPGTEAGGDEPHNNMQPYLPMSYIILAFGGYTPDDAIPEPESPVPAMFDRSQFDEADQFSRQSAVILT